MNQQCAVSQCNGKHYSLGFCRPHYRRLKLYGHPTADHPRKGRIHAFIDEALKSETDDCINWPYGKMDGYGVLRSEGRMWLAHRRVCVLAHGEPPTPLHEAAHSCGNGKLGCINPRHLSWKTHQQNMADMTAHGTSRKGKPGTPVKLTEETVVEIRLLFDAGETSNRKIGARYGISPQAVARIGNRTAWAWLP